MDDNYATQLAQILFKAHGRIDAETGETIDIGDEVQRLRNICYRLQVDSETLKHVSEQSQPVPDGFVLVPKDMTCAMVGEAHSVDQSHGSWPRTLWQRLLAAAPKPGGDH